MTAQWIAINEVPPSGRTYTVDTPAVWNTPLAEFGIGCQIVTPLSGEVTLLPQEEGCLVRGRLQGQVTLPCNRCAEDASVVIDSRFESFEPYPLEEELATPFKQSQKTDVLDEPADEAVVRLVGGTPEINLAGLLWEEFMLSLPVKPLCQPECLGLCPVCGKNLNEGPCQCAHEEGDPRFAALRNVKVARPEDE